VGPRAGHLGRRAEHLRHPCAVVDRDTGTVWLLATHNIGIDEEREIIAGTGQGTRTVWVTSSGDDGRTWAEPQQITDAVKPDEWTWYATGPGVGIQLRHKPHRGRLVIPCDHIVAGTKKYYSHVIYSDDHGKTWQLGGSSPSDQVNECQVVELADGRLMLNMRNYDRRCKQRAVCFSADGGVTWTDQRHDAKLIEPICQAGLIRREPAEAGDCPVVLFSNPASTTRRERMTVRLSCDDGQTWPMARTLHAGPAAYSCLAALPDGRFACLFEAGERHAYQKIRLARFGLDWLTEGRPLPRHSAITPAPRGWWFERHLRVNERVAQGDVDLIFIGDSITHGWEGGGKDVWAHYYGDRKAVNLGFSGDRTQHVLWRLEHGNIDGISPKAAVIMIGTNNSNGEDNTAEEIAEGIAAIVGKLRADLPRTKVLVLGIFPRGPQPDAQREKNAEASRLASKLADGKMIHYLDIGPEFLTQDGTLSPDIMPDFLHPNTEGYKIWARAMEPKLAELLGKQPRRE